MSKSYLTIELGRGATYANNLYTVYRHGTYERSSVLAGSPKREWVDDFETLEEAQAAYPDADVCVGGTTYQPLSLNHLPAEGEDDEGADLDDPYR